MLQVCVQQVMLQVWLRGHDLWMSGQQTGTQTSPAAQQLSVNVACTVAATVHAWRGPRQTVPMQYVAAVCVSTQLT